MSIQKQESAAVTEATTVSAQESDDVTKPGAGGTSWRVVVLCTVGLFASLYIFLIGLFMLGESFKCLGGKGAGGLFKAIQNPIAGLMTGVLATVMVQSSSTSTSIVVGLVGAEQITVRTGIPIIMGANIGTSVTNTIVSMGHVSNRFELQRAFAGATVHDMFNYLTVLTVLPVEVIVGAIQGEGGPIYWITEAVTNALMGSEKATGLFKSPIELATKPVAELFIQNDKHVITALSLGAPAEFAPNATNASLCSSTGGADCSRYYCVSLELDKNLKEISSSAYKTKLTKCDGHILEPASPCLSSEVCYLDAGRYYREYVTENHIISGGITAGAGDLGGGIVSLVVSLLCLSLGLVCLTKCLHRLFIGRAKRVIVMSTKLNDYVALLIGVAITIVVQSSSVITSALTPFCGLGLLTLEKMLPLTLGANIGTTVTALIAALTKMSHNTIHIALCHLFFNIIGILIWFPAPFMRRFPLGAARLLGLYASFYRGVPVIYLLVAFVLLPGVALGVSSLFDASVAGGVVLLLVLLAALGGFEFWWVWMGGCYKVISEEDRVTGWEECKKHQKEILDEQVGAQEADTSSAAYSL